LTAGFAAALAVAAFAAPGLAAASPAPSPAQSASTVLSKADFVGASGLVSFGKPAGIIPARTASASALGTAAAPSAEPDSNLIFHGGFVQQSPRVYLLFWGHKWTTSGLHKTVKNRLINLYKGLGRTPKDTWSLTESQYSGKGGRPTFGRSFFVKSAVDTSALPSGGIGINDLAAEAAKGAGIFGLPVSLADHNVEIVIAVQSGACFQPVGNGINFAGNCGIPPGPTTSGYCAFHSFDVANGNSNIVLPWVNMPFQLDAQAGCGENFINKGSAGQLDGFTIVSGHETAETVTDPAESGWFDQNDPISGGEIADKCAWGGSAWQQSPPDPARNIGLVTGSFPMQSLWSNAQHRCVMTGKLPFRVTHLANQTSIVGKAVSVQVSAATTPKVPLTFKASGLPKGCPSIAVRAGSAARRPRPARSP
jgi:serine protease